MTTHEWLTVIGKRLRKARTLRGLTTRDLAPLVGVSQTTISFWENARNAPTLAHLYRVAAVLDVDPGVLTTTRRKEVTQ